MTVAFQLAFAQSVLEVLQHQVIERQAFEAVVVLEELEHALPVAGRHVMERGRLQLDIVLLDGRIELDRQLLGRLAHHLLARARPFGHEDLHVAAHFALAGQPDAGPVLRA